MTTSPIDDGMIVDLTSAQCWEHLGRQHLGRVAFVFDGRIEMFPVNYVVDDGQLHILTAGGRKHDAFAARRDVVFEVDDDLGDVVWSVIVRGIGGELSPDEKREADRRRPITSFADTYKPHRVRIEPVLVTGRILPTPPSHR